MKNLCCGLMTPMLAITLTTVACGGSDDTDFGGDADFSAVSNQDRAFAASMVVTGDLTTAFMVFITEASSQSGCPAKSVAGDVVTYTGGCTNDEGDEYQGTLTATNGQLDLFEDSSDPEQPTTYEFDNFSILDSDPEAGDFAIDGTISYSRGLREVGQVANRTNHFTLELAGADDSGAAVSAALELDAASRCEMTGETATSCEFLADSTGALAGAGRFGIAGSFAIADNAISGQLTLTGANTLVVDLGECATFTLDGSPDGEFCGAAQ